MFTFFIGKRTWILWALCIPFTVLAQDSINFSDTFNIHEVSVVSKVSGKYQAGLQEVVFDDQKLESASSGNLETLISRYTPIYIKGDAAGLSTIRIRGTSPDHTSILVGGLDINSLTLGHSNFSTIPVYLFDNIGLQIGGASAENGSGSIGGSVNLGFDYQWTDGFSLDLQGTTGSFGEYMGGTKIRLGNGKLESVTRVVSYQKENNFPFEVEFKDYEKGEYYTKTFTQDLSAVEQLGVIQEINYKISEKSNFTSFVWYQHELHEIQPTINSAIYPDSAGQAELLENNNIRFWSKYNSQIGKTTISLGIGAVHDKQIYKEDEVNTIETKRVISNMEAGRKFNYGGKLKLGIKYKYIVPIVYAYEDNLEEQQLDAYLSYYQRFFSKLQVSMNLRQMWVKNTITNYNAPFTPSIGVDYLLVSKPSYVLSLVGNASLSYRIPTFNHRYWGDVGNPYLKPEEGKNAEAGIKYSYCSPKVQSNLRLQTYYMDVDNWLRWVVGGIAFPENVDHVVSKGIEFTSNTTINLGKRKIETGANYSLNSTVRKTSKNITEVLNQQLEYVPMNTANIWINWIFNKNFNWSVDGNYVGWRYYTTEDYLDGYFLLNTEIAYRFKVNKHALRLGLQAYNILDTSYQNQNLYAMPGRSFRATLKWNIKT